MALTTVPNDLSFQPFITLPALASQSQISPVSALDVTDKKRKVTRFTQQYGDSLRTESQQTNVALWKAIIRSNDNNIEEYNSSILEASRLREIRICIKFLTPASILSIPNYADFTLAIAQDSLMILNDRFIFLKHRREAMQKMSSKFEELADPVHHPPRVSVNKLIRDRELGVSTRFYLSSTVRNCSGGTSRKKRRNITDSSSRITNEMDANQEKLFPGNTRADHVSPTINMTGALAVEYSALQHPTSRGESLERIQATAHVYLPENTRNNESTPPSIVSEPGHDLQRRYMFPRVDTRSYRRTEFELNMASAFIRRPGAPHVQYLNHMEDKARQFEYNPSIPSELVYGTENGYIVVIDQETGEVRGSCLGRGRRGIRPAGQVIRQTSRMEDTVRVRNNHRDHMQNLTAASAVYGLSWLNKRSEILLSGAFDGSIHMYNVNWMKTRKRGGCVYTYQSFPDLTSVHANSDDTRFVVSGSQHHVALYDLETGKRIEVIHNCHKGPINTTKFSHKSPHVFVTSSFDRFVKTWDLRQQTSGGRRDPIFEAVSRMGNMMVCFSPDDSRLLVSAENNEVRQYTTLDGRLELEFKIPKLSSSFNYTRSYYMNDGEYIITGSCSKNVIRVYNAKTGAWFSEVDMDNRKTVTGRQWHVQSLQATSTSLPCLQHISKEN